MPGNPGLDLAMDAVISASAFAGLLWHISTGILTSMTMPQTRLTYLCQHCIVPPVRPPEGTSPKAVAGNSTHSAVNTLGKVTHRRDRFYNVLRSNSPACSGGQGIVRVLRTPDMVTTVLQDLVNTSPKYTPAGNGRSVVADITYIYTREGFGLISHWWPMPQQIHSGMAALAGVWMEGLGCHGSLRPTVPTE